MRTLGSAFRHQVSLADISYALSHALAYVVQEDGITMCLGPDRAGHLLEIGVVDRSDEQIVIHAMPMRRKYEQHIPR